MNDDEEAQARREICRVGKSLFDRGYAHGTAGNISVRLEDGGGFLITPTDACLGFLDPDALAKLDEAGNPVSGERASKTIELHRRIYAADATARCVVHTHSAHSVALTLLPRMISRRVPWPFSRLRLRVRPELLAPITPYFVMKVGHVPVLAYQRPGAPEVADQVAATIATYARAPIRAVMLERLGPVVWHDSPARAMATLEELEETARLTLLARALVTGAEPGGLSIRAIAKLRELFNARW